MAEALAEPASAFQEWADPAWAAAEWDGGGGRRVPGTACRWQKSSGANLQRNRRTDVRSFEKRAGRSDLFSDRRRAAQPVQPGLHARSRKCRRARLSQDSGCSAAERFGRPGPGRILLQRQVTAAHSEKWRPHPCDCAQGRLCRLSGGYLALPRWARRPPDSGATFERKSLRTSPQTFSDSNRRVARSTLVSDSSAWSRCLPLEGGSACLTIHALRVGRPS